MNLIWRDSLQSCPVLAPVPREMFGLRTRLERVPHPHQREVVVEVLGGHAELDIRAAQSAAAVDARQGVRSGKRLEHRLGLVGSHGRERLVGRGLRAGTCQPLPPRPGHIPAVKALSTSSSACG